MTHPALGRALPVHFYMVALAGWGQVNPGNWRQQWEEDAWDHLSDESRAVDEMCAGRTGLIRMTMNDFGWDLMQWRSFFLDNWDADPDGSERCGGFGYNHPYAASIVDRIVQEAIARPDRPRLEALAETAWPEKLQTQLAWYQKEWKDPDEPLWLAAVRDWPFE